MARLAPLTSNAQNHYFGGFYKRSRGLPRLQVHFPRRTCSDDRSDLLLANRNLYFGHQSADPDRVNASHQLVASTHAADHKFAFLLGSTARSEKQPIQLALRNAMMSSHGLHTADFVFVNPLLESRKADAQL